MGMEVVIEVPLTIWTAIVWRRRALSLQGLYFLQFVFPHFPDAFSLSARRAGAQSRRCAIPRPRTGLRHRRAGIRLESLGHALRAALLRQICRILNIQITRSAPRRPTPADSPGD